MVDIPKWGSDLSTAVTKLSVTVDHLTASVTKLEGGIDRLDEKIDGLSESVKGFDSRVLVLETTLKTTWDSIKVFGKIAAVVIGIVFPILTYFAKTYFDNQFSGVKSGSLNRSNAGKDSDSSEQHRAVMDGFVILTKPVQRKDGKWCVSISYLCSANFARSVFVFPKLEGPNDPKAGKEIDAIMQHIEGSEPLAKWMKEKNESIPEDFSIEHSYALRYPSTEVWDKLKALCGPPVARHGITDEGLFDRQDVAREFRLNHGSYFACLETTLDKNNHGPIPKKAPDQKQPNAEVGGCPCGRSSIPTLASR